MFRRFGMQSGRNVDKFEYLTPSKDAWGMPYIEWSACAVFSAKVLEQIDLGSHTLFIAEVEDAKVLSPNGPLTYADYQSRLMAANAMDFDDLILQTVLLLQRDEQTRSFYQRKFRYVLIDEYQDTNRLQYLLARYLTGENGNICVVGDDDQSIYKFRGATIANILSFERQ